MYRKWIRKPETKSNVIDATKKIDRESSGKVKVYEIFVQTGQWKPKKWWCPRLPHTLWSAHEMRDALLDKNSQDKKPASVIVIQFVYSDGKRGSEVYIWA